MRVVIAEDEAIIRMDLRETLEEEGYEVVGETGRGDQAVELARALQPDLAILDRSTQITTSNACTSANSSCNWGRSVDLPLRTSL